MNMTKTHGEQIGGGTSGYLEEWGRPISDGIHRILSRMNGDDRTTYSIWRLAEPGGDPRRMGETFIQAAGSADKLAIEARVMTSDGTSHLYAVGRQEPHNNETTTVPISDKRMVRVFTNEIFTADEAAVIFMTFYLTDAVAQPYQLREIDLSVPQSEER
jgi:hypothetical protein